MRNIKFTRNQIVLAVVALILVAVAGVVWASNGSKPSSTTVQPTSQPKGPAADKTTPTPSTSATPVAGSVTATPAASSAPAPTPSATLAAPTGQTLNKFQISLTSTDDATSPAMNTSCQTVIGGRCGLKLTGPSGQTKQIDPTATDSQGGNSFDWNAKTLGLTAGVWKVQLYATYNNQAGLSATYDLTVQP